MTALKCLSCAVEWTNEEEIGTQRKKSSSVLLLKVAYEVSQKWVIAVIANSINSINIISVESRSNQVSMNEGLKGEK